MGNTGSNALLKLGAAIRRYRVAQGLTQAALGAKIFKSDGTVSDLELAKILRPEAAVLRSLEEALELPPDTLIDFLDMLDSESLPGWFRDWLEPERRARVLRSFQGSLVDGLLQTEDYARAVLKGDEAAVAARLARQEILTRDDPPKLRCVFDETVLYRKLGDAKVMHDQLLHLTEAVSDHVSVQVVPIDANPHRSGAFVLATVERSEFAYIETAIRGIVTTSREDIGGLEDIWETIRVYALSQRESAELIRKVATERWT